MACSLDQEKIGSVQLFIKHKEDNTILNGSFFYILSQLAA